MMTGRVALCFFLLGTVASFDPPSSARDACSVCGDPFLELSVLVILSTDGLVVKVELTSAWRIVEGDAFVLYLNGTEVSRHAHVAHEPVEGSFVFQQFPSGSLLFEVVLVDGCGCALSNEPNPAISSEDGMWVHMPATPAAPKDVASLWSSWVPENGPDRPRVQVSSLRSVSADGVSTEKYFEDHLDTMTAAEVYSKLYTNGVMNQTYHGIPIWKHPTDLWVYQDILWERRPDFVIEVGTACGASALWLAHQMDHIQHGHVITIGPTQPGIFEPSEKTLRHPRVTYLDAMGQEVYNQVKALLTPGSRVMVIEDSAHTYQNTLEMLRLYSGLVTVGDYFIVEDSTDPFFQLSGLPWPGPYGAIVTFLKSPQGESFKSDRKTREKFFLTGNVNGFLLRVQ